MNARPAPQQKGSPRAATTISVVFPAHNNLAQLRKTLPAIAAQNLPEHATAEVIVVDDGSAPETADWLSSCTLPGIRVLRLAKNVGRAAARNAGVRSSSADIIVFLDSDVLVGPDFLAAHLKALEEGATAGDAARRMSLGVLVDTETLDQGPGQTDAGSHLGMAHFTTANVAMPRNLLLEVQETDKGPFDEVTFNRYGWEDLELERRLLQVKPQRVRNAQALGFHHSPPFRIDELDRLIAKEVDRALMARRFFAKHPTFAVRLMIQATPVHRALWEILSLGGALNAKTMAPVFRWLEGRKRWKLAAVLARLTILNPAYIRAL
ncbi:MAG: glycosyltransferase [Pseudomonadota bacterium]